MKNSYLVSLVGLLLPALFLAGCSNREVPLMRNISLCRITRLADTVSKGSIARWGKGTTPKVAGYADGYLFTEMELEVTDSIFDGIGLKGRVSVLYPGAIEADGTSANGLVSAAKGAGTAYFALDKIEDRITVVNQGLFWLEAATIVNAGAYAAERGFPVADFESAVLAEKAKGVCPDDEHFGG